MEVDAVTLTEKREFVEGMGKFGCKGIIIGLLTFLAVMFMSAPLEAKSLMDVISIYPIPTMIAVVCIFSGGCLFTVSISTATYLHAFKMARDEIQSINNSMDEIRRLMRMSDANMMANIATKTFWNEIPIPVENVNILKVRNLLKKKLEHKTELLFKVKYPEKPWTFKIAYLKRRLA